MSNSLLDRWINIKLGDVLELKYGKSLPAKTRDGEGYPVYGSNGVVGQHSLPLVSTEGIIVGRKGSYGEVQLSLEPFFPIDTTYFIDELFEQPLKYWFYQLKNLPLTQLNRSTAIPGLNREDAYSQEIKLPPLAEQKVIAEKLDKLLAKVDSIKERLDAVPDTLKRFRQSVLAAAVSGKLTEEWRKESSIGSNNYLSDLSEEVKTRRGVPAGVRKNDQISSFDFPKSWGIWSIASLLRKGVIVDLKDGNHGSNHPKASEFTPKGLPFITAAQMDAKGNIDYINAPKVSGKPLSKLKVGFAHEGDVIYSHKGTVGRVSICSRDCVLSPQTTYIRLDTNYVNNSYYKIMCMSDVFTKQVDAIKSQTTRDFVPITTHYTLFAAIPTISEQTEIVRLVENLFAYADKVEVEVNAAQERVNKLTQSILAKAFRGELTAKWREQNLELISGENSAEALLEKIKAEREKLKPTKKRKAK